MTLPLQELGIEIYGSDLSDAMLERCRRKAMSKGRPVELRCCDFRSLSAWDDNLFDCVASTGNSLGYVSNADVVRTLEEMDAHVRPKGFICLDSRNREKIQREKQRFYLYNPFFHDGVRVNLVQVWDNNQDGTISFNLLYTFERDNRIVQKEIFEERYNPFALDMVMRKLALMGYEDIDVRPVPCSQAVTDIGKMDWYRIMARKN